MRLSKNPAKRARQIRDAVIELLGGRCEHCGETRWEVFHIDHRNADGYLERQRMSRNGRGRISYPSAQLAWKLWGEKGPEAVIKKFQALCANCHHLKTVEEQRNRARGRAPWERRGEFSQAQPETEPEDEGPEQGEMF